MQGLDFDKTVFLQMWLISCELVKGDLEVELKYQTYPSFSAKCAARC